MRKILIGFGCLCLVAVFALTLAPPRASAAPPYLCSNSSNTAVRWGKGATCEAATQDLRDQLYPLVNSACSQAPFSGSCGSSLVITGACRDYSGGGKVVDGYMSYRCRFYPDL